MKYTALRESPIPVIVALAALLGFVEYLHWTVVRQEDRPIVVQVPAVAPVDDPLGDGEPVEGFTDEPVAETTEPGPAGPLHARAREMADSGRSGEALRLLEQSIGTEGPRDAVRAQERGLLLLRLGQPEEARASLTEAVRAGGRTPVLLYNLGLARARTGDTGGAEAAYRAALDLNPLFDEAWNNLGLLLEARGDRTGAIDALRRAIDLAQTGVRYRPSINLARILGREGRHEEGIALLEEAIRYAPGVPAPRLVLANLVAATPAGTEKTREILGQVIRLTPRDPVGYFHMAQFEARLGNPEEAERYYMNALEVAPGDRRARLGLAGLMLDGARPVEAARQFEILLDQAADPRAAFGLGRARRAIGDLAGAEAAYREAIRSSGGAYPEALFNLGILLTEADRPTDAEAAYREALALQPDYASAWINLSLLLAEQEQRSEALQAVERALAADAKNEKAWFVKGRQLSDSGRREEALLAYGEAMRLRPGYTKARLNAAVLHAAAGRSDLAINLYQEVLAIDPRNALAWYNLGIALHRADRDPEAREAYEKALAADPESTRAAQNLGVLYAREGRIEEARALLSDALERHPEDTGLRYNLALQLEKLKRHEAAIREIERVVSLDPDHERAWTVLARLLEARGEGARATVARGRAEQARSRRPGVGDATGDEP